VRPCVSTSATRGAGSTPAVDVLRLRNAWTAGSSANATKTARITPDIGLVTKPVASPPNMSKDRRVLDSMMDPSTKANTIGPGSKPAFFIR